MLNMATFLEKMKSQQKFLVLVYSTLTIQLIITFFIIFSLREHPLLSKITRQSIWLYFICAMALLLIIILVHMPLWLRVIMCLIFTTFMAAMLHSMSFFISEQVINQALIGTIAIFVSMTVFSCVVTWLGWNISWLSMYLFAGLIGLIVASCITLIINTNDPIIHKYLVFFGLILFSLFIIYDTNVILHNNAFKGNFIQASLDFYLSFINVFVRLL